MPAERSKSVFAGVTVDRDTLAAAAAAPVQGGTRIGLPPGAKGVAELREMRFDTYKGGKKSGKAYFLANAVCLSPDSVIVDGVAKKVAGLTTQIMIDCHDTGEGENARTAIENVCGKDGDKRDSVYSIMKKLGADLSTVTELSDLEVIAQALKEHKPPIRFRYATSVKKPYTNPTTGKTSDPGVWENWYNAIDYTPEGSNPANAEVSYDGGYTDNSPLDVNFTLPDDVDELVGLTTHETHGGAAVRKLKELGIEKGMSSADVDVASSWDEVAAFIKGDSATAVDEPYTGYVPNPKACVYVNIFDPVKKTKTDKRRCIVLSVDEKNRTALLKDLVKGAPLSNGQGGEYGPVAWKDIATS